MNDKALLCFYLGQANRWNLSPEAAFMAYSLREYAKNRFRPSNGYRVCNVGIGVGDWDDYLCYWLEGKGQLTSVDVDGKVCERLQYRQEREEHPNPANVICMSILNANVLPPGYFDLLTIVGSTLDEVAGHRKDRNRKVSARKENYRKALDACFNQLKPGGRLMYMDLFRWHKPRQFESYIAQAGHTVAPRQDFRATPQEFYIFTARKRR